MCDGAWRGWWWIIAFDERFRSSLRCVYLLRFFLFAFIAFARRSAAGKDINILFLFFLEQQNHRRVGRALLCFSFPGFTRETFVDVRIFSPSSLGTNEQGNHRWHHFFFLSPFFFTFHLLTVAE